MTALVHRSLSLAPASLDRPNRTVLATLSTGAAVTRAGYVERLATGPDAVTVAARVPLLDSHRQGSIRDILGSVTGIRHEAGGIVATLKISSDEALAAIERGDIGGVSIGYRVTEWDAPGGRVRTATKWTLAEASLVAIPADAGATFRNLPMPPEDTTTTADPATTTAAPPPDTRARDIRSLSTRAGLPSTWADAQIDSGATLLEARAATLDAILERGAQAPAIRTTSSSPGGDADHLVHRQTALAHRMAGLPLTDGARPYQHHRLIDHARDLLAMRGESTTGLAPDALLTRALHTTSDFPALLAGAGNRILLAPYTAALSPLRLLFRQSSAPDFRAKTLLRLSEAATLLKVNEAGEIRSGTRGESSESYKLETWARIFALTRQAIVNDDLHAFSDWSVAMGRAAAETENGLRAALLLENGGAGPTLADGMALFHTARGNYAAVGSVPTVASLSAARLALRTQTGLDGKTPLGGVPKYLVVPPSLETASEQVLATLAAATVATANPFSGRLELLVEARLPPTSWYVFCDPATHPIFEQSNLASAPGPQMDSRPGWEVLGVEYRVFEDFGCGAIGWRGCYRNPGVA